MKSLQKRLHAITFACFENQFRCRVLNFLKRHFASKVLVAISKSS